MSKIKQWPGTTSDGACATCGSMTCLDYSHMAPDAEYAKRDEDKHWPPEVVNGEAAFHKRIKGLAKREQGHVMQAFREVVADVLINLDINAQRYEVLRSNVLPRDMGIYTGIDPSLIQPNQTIEGQIDMLCDIVLGRYDKNIKSKAMGDCSGCKAIGAAYKIGRESYHGIHETR